MNASAEEFGLEYIIKSKRLLTKSWMLWKRHNRTRQKAMAEWFN